eukprot:m.159495 g.159495  ORF g.159495 m.159495 type:complete len:424 (+) comp23745_c0_seq1:773-2044(+)
MLGPQGLKRWCSIGQIVVWVGSSAVPLLEVIPEQVEVGVPRDDALWKVPQQLNRVLSEHPLPLLLDHRPTDRLAVLLLHLRLLLQLPLVLYPRSSVVNQRLDRSAVLETLHAALLRAQLFELVVLRKLLHHGLPELLLFHGRLLLGTSRALEQVGAVSLQLDTHAALLLHVCSSTLLHGHPHLLLVQLLPHPIHLVCLAASPCGLFAHLGLQGLERYTLTGLGCLDRCFAGVCLGGLPRNDLILAFHLLEHAPFVRLALLLERLLLGSCVCLVILRPPRLIIVLLLDPEHNLVDHCLVFQELFVRLVSLRLLGGELPVEITLVPSRLLEFGQGGLVLLFRVQVAAGSKLARRLAKLSGLLLLVRHALRDLVLELLGRVPSSQLCLELAEFWRSLPNLGTVLFVPQLFSLKLCHGRCECFLVGP